MDFEQRLLALAAKINAQREVIQTEEATKNAFIMPFISTILGYDIFNPLEVVPEFTADIGLKRGEKVDYAIMRDGEVQVLIECKKLSDELNVEHASQLFRYFSVTNARIAVLTNGEVYNFYTDLDEPNRMDDRPFLVLDLSNIDETLLPELQKLTKESFDLESIISTAEELKYVGAIKREIAAQFKNPSEELVRFYANCVYKGRLTQDVRTLFTSLVEKASKQYLNEQVNDRLKAALGTTSVSAENVESEISSEEAVEQNLSLDGIETTLEELEGYRIIKAIACSEVKPDRIVHRDAKSYFAVLLDDNNRKTIARLHFNSKSKKYVGLLDENRNETRYEIQSLDELYNFASDIRGIVQRLLLPQPIHHRTRTIDASSDENEDM